MNREWPSIRRYEAAGAKLQLLSVRGSANEYIAFRLMNRRILIAPDKFKGSLSAPEAVSAIAEGIRQLDPTAELDLCPIADGGEGFMEAVAKALSARWVRCPAVDALGREVESRYVLADTEDGPVAVIEMAETAGLWRLDEDERNPQEATTRGVGMQMVHAVREHAVARIILGLGGSATNDGGCGMAAELGVEFLDKEGREVDPQPSKLELIHDLDFGKKIELPEVTAACDVDNPLLGESGATAVFSAQKGATDAMKLSLEKALAHLVEVSGGDEPAATPGAGAAGGLGFGLLHFAGARLVSGFDLLAGLLDLESRIQAAEGSRRGMSRHDTIRATTTLTPTGFGLWVLGSASRPDWLLARRG